MHGGPRLYALESAACFVWGARALFRSCARNGSLSGQKNEQEKKLHLLFFLAIIVLIVLNALLAKDLFYVHEGICHQKAQHCAVGRILRRF